jgi:hypothetical protein
MYHESYHHESYKILGKTRDFPPHKLSTNSTSEVRQGV